MSSVVTNAFASSSSSRIRSESEWPVIASARRPVTRSRIDVRSSSPHLAAGAPDLRHQISRDGALAAGEVAHESLRVRMPGE